jgi:hypothetical protein
MRSVIDFVSYPWKRGLLDAKWVVMLTVAQVALAFLAGAWFSFLAPAMLIVLALLGFVFVGLRNRERETRLFVVIMIEILCRGITALPTAAALCLVVRLVR